MHAYQDPAQNNDLVLHMCMHHRYTDSRGLQMADILHVVYKLNKASTSDLYATDLISPYTLNSQFSFDYFCTVGVLKTQPFDHSL